MTRRIFAAAAALAAVAVPVAAQTPVQVPAFDSVELRGGGTVTIRHGARQSVRLVSGDAETSRFEVDGEGRLTITACRSSCRDYQLRVEIVTPDIEGLAIRGGGSIRTEGDFPYRSALAAAVRGGGNLDATAIEAGTVSVGIQGGGSIRTHARDRLVAGIQGGGSVRYLGDPQVTSGIEGGGSVSPMR